MRPVPERGSLSGVTTQLAQVAALMGRQHGLLLRRQALAAGLTALEVDRLRRTGEWVAVRRGVYTSRARWESLEPYVGRPRARVLAASLAMEVPHVMSHDSAALLLGLPVLLGEPETVHVTRPRVVGGRGTAGVTHHLASYDDRQVVLVDGVRVLDAARTAVDVARDAGMRRGLVACDSALRSGVARDLLSEAVVPMRSWPGVTMARRCVALADARAETVGESLLRLLVVELGLGEVDLQFGLGDASRTGWADLRVGRHLFEFDGHLKYRRPDQGGVADADPDQVLWREKKRQAWFTGFRLGMSRVTWVDLRPEHWRATGVRLVREHAATRAAYGDSVDDLAPFRLPPRTRARTA